MRLNELLARKLEQLGMVLKGRAPVGKIIEHMD